MRPAPGPRSLLHHCRNPQILKTSCRTALVVGTALAFINHYHGILNLRLSGTEVTQILITYLVPFIVATYSAARHLQYLESLNLTPAVGAEPADESAEPTLNRQTAAAPALSSRRNG